MIVHGVGHQKEGATARATAQRIVTALADMGIVATQHPLPVAEDLPCRHTVAVAGSRPVVVAESHWASIIRDNRGRRARDAFARLWLLISVLPFLLAAVIYPRAHEPALEKVLLSTPKTWRAAFTSFLTLMRATAPTLWRSIALIGIVLLVGVGLAALPWWGIAAVAVGALVVLWLLVRWRWDVTEHVRVASLASDVRTLIENRLCRDIDVVAAQCDDVWVIGHSQGGYLAHRVLSEKGRGRWPTVKKFTGLASGVRPIRLISMVRADRWAWTGWVMLTGVAVMMSAMMWGFEPGGVVNTSGTQLFTQMLLVGMVQPQLIGNEELAEAIWKNTWPTQWFMIPGLVIGIGLFAVGVIAGRRAGRRMTSIPPIPSRMIWEELTSPSDIVGSMSVPELPPVALRRTIPSLRQPVGDHLMASYLSRRSTFRLELARWVTRGSSAASRFAQVDALTVDLTALSARSYRLRLAVQAACTGLFVLIPVAVLGRSLFAASTSFVVGGAIVALAIALITAAWWFLGASRRMSRFLSAANNARAYRTTRWHDRRPWALILCGISATAAILGSLGALIYARDVEITALGALLSPVTIGLRQSSGALMAAATLTVCAIWLGVAGIRGVRLLLAFAALMTINAIGDLARAGDLWLYAGMPGVGMPALVGLGVVTAFVGCARVTTSSPSTPSR
ncbi:hypothetical protein [Microbacterium phyllosphaerae]|uniref:hypothetical protein n=1 Tax=Microbacterium phyllosphaerae TaxID=124798 RepID=UPI003D65D102